MHSYSELAARCTWFMLDALNQLTERLIGDGSEASTPFVKNLQAVQLGKVVAAVGLFSIFEARLQDALATSDGFAGLRSLLAKAGETELGLRFEQYSAAINALKHGTGRSYEWLLTRKEELPFVIKGRDQGFFYEGDVSEVDTLVLVNDAFVKACAELVDLCVVAVQTHRPDVFFV